MICYGERTERIFATAQLSQILRVAAFITVWLTAFHGPAVIALFSTSTVGTRVRAATSFLQMISTWRIFEE